MPNASLQTLRIAGRKIGPGEPVILSTGMATRAEIDEAVGTLRTAGCRQLALLKCTCAYPAAAEQMNLRTIPHLAETFSVPAGLSDHSLDPAVPAAAVACGACIIEKHLTLSRADGGPDDEEAAAVRLRRSLFVVVLLFEGCREEVKPAGVRDLVLLPDNDRRYGNVGESPLGTGEAFLDSAGDEVGNLPHAVDDLGRQLLEPVLQQSADLFRHDRGML